MKRFKSLLKKYSAKKNIRHYDIDFLIDDLKSIKPLYNTYRLVVSYNGFDSKFDDKIINCIGNKYNTGAGYGGVRDIDFIFNTKELAFENKLKVKNYIKNKIKVEIWDELEEKKIIR